MGAGSKCPKHRDCGKETSGVQASSFTPESRGTRTIRISASSRPTDVCCERIAFMEEWLTIQELAARVRAEKLKEQLCP
jgi:hypothetical protein